MGAAFAADRIFRRRDALGGGVVGELDLAGDVADRIDGGDFGATEFVGVDEAARVYGKPRVLEPETVSEPTGTLACPGGLPGTR